MKIVALLLLVAAAGQLNAQRSDFVEYLLQLQYIADPLHDYMAVYYADARTQLSELLTGLNEDAVREITDALRAIIGVRDRTEESVADLTTPENQACVNTALTSWQSALETAGTDVSGCASEFVDPIYELTEQFHLFIQANNQKSFDAQNMVLNLFTEFNPLTQADQLTPTIERQFDEIFNVFEIEVKPYLERMLFDVEFYRNSVPAEIYTCVDSSIVRLNEAAFVVLDAVAAC